MDSKRKLQQRMEKAQEQQLAAQQRHGVREFGSIEDLLRYDAAKTAVPPGLATRLQQSIAREPAPRAGWWQRLFGG